MGVVAVVFDALVIIGAITLVAATGIEIETRWGKGTWTSAAGHKVNLAAGVVGVLLLTVGLVAPHLAFFQSGSSTPPSVSGPTSGGPASHPAGVLADATLQYDGDDNDPFDLDFDPPKHFGSSNTVDLGANEIDVVHNGDIRGTPAWTASSMPGRQDCADALAQSSAGFPGSYPNLTVGLTFCVVTGQGHLAAVQVTDAAAHYTVHVVVWN